MTIQSERVDSPEAVAELILRTLAQGGQAILLARLEPPTPETAPPQNRPNEESAQDRVLTPQEAAILLRIGKNRISQLLRSGEIKSKKVGRRYLIPESEIRNFLCKN